MSNPCVSVSRRVTLREVAPWRGATARWRGRRVHARAGVAGLRASRLGGSRGRCTGRAPPRPRHLPEPQQEGCARPEFRSLRQAHLGGERDAARRRRYPR